MLVPRVIGKCYPTIQLAYCLSTSLAPFRRLVFAEISRHLKPDVFAACWEISWHSKPMLFSCFPAKPTNSLAHRRENICSRTVKHFLGFKSLEYSPIQWAIVTQRLILHTILPLFKQLKEWVPSWYNRWRDYLNIDFVKWNTGKQMAPQYVWHVSSKIGKSIYS